MAASLTRRRGRVAAAILPLLLLLSARVPAANIVVGCDAQICICPCCTLVDAIKAANTDAPSGFCTAGSGADQITILPGNPSAAGLVLTSVQDDLDGPNGLPTVTSTITIRGNGETIERSDTAPPFRLFHVALSGDLTLADLVLKGGRVAPVGAGQGGGIFNRGVLTIRRSTLTDNEALGGPGAAGTAGGPGGTGGQDLLGNGAPGGTGGTGGAGSPGAAAQGGALYNAASGTVTLEQVVFDANRVLGGRGGDGGQGGRGGLGGTGAVGTPTKNGAPGGAGGTGGPGATAGAGGAAQGAAIYDAGGRVAALDSAFVNGVVTAGEGGIGGLGGNGGNGGAGGNGYFKIVNLFTFCTNGGRGGDAGAHGPGGHGGQGGVAEGGVYLTGDGTAREFLNVTVSGNVVAAGRGGRFGTFGVSTGTPGAGGTVAQTTLDDACKPGSLGGNPCSYPCNVTGLSGDGGAATGAGAVVGIGTTFKFSTVAFNSANGGPGGAPVFGFTPRDGPANGLGLRQQQQAASPLVRATIISDNRRGSGRPGTCVAGFCDNSPFAPEPCDGDGDCVPLECVGFHSDGSNLTEDACLLGPLPSDKTNATADLQPLAQNGDVHRQLVGATWTHALGPDSQAVDAAFCATPAFFLREDQRGYARPGDANPDQCDIGAFERGQCGDGAIQTGEQCDLGRALNGLSSCCSASCQTRVGETCRPRRGICDLEERCVGDLTCPADQLFPSSAICRGVGNLACDVAERCDGQHPDCPPDGFAPPTTVCRPATGICDVAERCTGSSTDCPRDTLVPANTMICRAGSGICDQNEFCTGASAACPPDVPAPSGTFCRFTSAACESPVCDGTSKQCPPFRPATYVCRQALGECDVAEHCTGSSTGCPPDTLVAAATPCTPDDKLCTRDICDGTSAACTHPAGNAGAVCRPADGECDAAETCLGGNDVECPPDVKRPADAPCGDPRETACDAADSCDDAGVCQPQRRPDGTACTDDENECTADACHAGACAHPSLPDGTPCADEGATCTDDVCMSTADEVAACVHSPVDARCDVDGDACTIDACDPADPAAAAGSGCVARGVDPRCEAKEICDGCVDDDADGRVDFADDACCDPALAVAMSVKRGGVVPGGTTSALRLRALLGVGGAPIDPAGRDLVLQVGQGLCARIPAASFVHKGKKLVFKDRKGTVASAEGLEVVQLVQTGRGLKLLAKGRRIGFGTAAGESLDLIVALAVAGGEASSCASQPQALRVGEPQRRSGGRSALPR